MSGRTRVLGINRRNAIIARENPRHAVRLVKDKAETKRVLANDGVPVPPTLLHLVDDADVMTADWQRLPDAWVMKPVHGSMGRGVLVVRDRRDGVWIEASGGDVDRARLVSHARSIIDGEHTSGRHDAVIVEPLLVSHPALGEIAPVGLPDIRVIVHRGRPILAMLRIPTVASGGRGNLHQGGIGAAIHLGTGRIDRAVLRGRPVTHHPESGEPIVGSRIPMWSRVMEVAEGITRATGLGYLGADIVVDEVLGVAVLEVNSHPGLEIQNVCGVGLGSVLVA